MKAHRPSEVVFQRSAGQRLFFGVGTVLLALLMGVAVQREQRDAALYQQAAGTATTLSDAALMLSMLVIFLGLLCFVFLWMAGSHQVRFDLDRSQYCLTRGFPLMARTRRGSTEGGVFYVVRNRSGRHLMKFRPVGHKWGFLLGTYAADEQARTEAHRMAAGLGLTVERRDVN